jgi:PPOX class probable F420-dependent enzyme
LDSRIAPLTKQRYISLTTYRRDGRAVATAVWFALDGNRILVWTDSASGKAKRIRATRRATVAPCDVRGRTNGAATDGTGRVLPNDEHERAMRILSTKYRLLKPLVDLWTTLGVVVLRRKRPVEIFLEITLSPVEARVPEGA